jgi:hypothetical protein
LDRGGEARRWSGASGVRGRAVFVACIGLALTVGVAAQSASRAPSFAGAKRYATGTLPESVAVGDLNGDGKLDLATANLGLGGEHTVSVFLNRGDGSFPARVDHGTGICAMSVAIGDLTGDGKPDLVTANCGNTVSVLLNRGDGSFRAGLDYATGNNPHSVTLGDLNGDGKPDLATANLDDNTVSVLVNRGDGSFKAALDYATGTRPVLAGGRGSER